MLRNKEIRRFAAVFLLLAAASVAAGFSAGRAAGLLAALFAAAFGAAFLVFTRWRYRRLARLAQQVDGVLHHDSGLVIAAQEEGELSILESEIAKMTLRIREQNQALQGEKQALADSLADIAHQLRTPLTSLSLILTLLQSETGPEKRKAYAREAEELLVRMDWLLTALLKLSRLDAGIVVFQRERVEVSGLVSAALRPLSIPMELRGIAVRVRVPQGAALTGDPGWLGEALQNLLKNGMESAGENGWMEIECQDNPLYTEIILRDSGPGFAVEDLPHLFDRFYRGGSQSKSGYGIGLALCRAVVMGQGGTITAKNHPEGGAVFTLRFPK